MKAISLWNPWAQAMAEGVKRHETRSWPTYYRGDLAICSAKRTMDNLGRGLADKHNIPALKYGVVLCVVELYSCIGTVAVGPTPVEREWGDWTPGRWAWLTRNLRKLEYPVPVVGRQGLWNLPPETVKLIEQQL